MKGELDKEEKIIKDQLGQLKEEGSLAQLLGGLLSLFISLGVGIHLRIIFYWLPASLSLIIIWTIYSFLINRKKSLTEEKAKKSIELIGMYNRKTWKYAAELFMKNISPIMSAVAMIFLINLVIILLHLSEVISLPFNGPFEITILSVVSIFFIFGRFVIDRFPQFFSEDVISSTKKLSKFEKNKKIPGLIRENAIKLVLTLGIIYMVSFILLYIWALILIFSFVENIWFLISIAILQFIIILLFSSYLSYRMVKSELKKGLVGIIRIKDGDLDGRFLYDVVKFCRFGIDSSLKVVNFFVVLRHVKYLEEIK